MPWRCATNCATAPSGCPPKGQQQVYPCTPGAPNRLQGGGDPGRGGHLGRAVPRLDPPSGAALDELGPVAVAQGTEHPPGEVVVEPEQPRRCRAARRTVRRDDEALPRPERLGRCSVRAAPTRSATSATVSPWSPRRASSPRARAACTSGQRSATSAALSPCQAPTSISRKRRSRSTGMPHARPTLSAVSRARVRSEETMRRGEQGRDRRPHGIRLSQPQPPTAACRGGPARCGPRCGRSRRAAGR